MGFHRNQIDGISSCTKHMGTWEKDAAVVAERSLHVAAAFQRD